MKRIALFLVLVMSFSLSSLITPGFASRSSSIVIYNVTGYAILGKSFVEITKPFSYVIRYPGVEINATIYPGNVSGIKVVYKGYKEMKWLTIINVDIYVPASYYKRIPIQIGVNHGLIVKVARLNETYLEIAITLRDVRIAFYYPFGLFSAQPIWPSVPKLGELPRDRNELRINGIPIWLRSVTWIFIVDKETGKAWLAQGDKLQPIGVLPLLPLSWGVNPYNYLSRITNNTRKAVVYLSENKELLEGIVAKIGSAKNALQRARIGLEIVDAIKRELVAPSYTYLDMKCVEEFSNNPLGLSVQCLPIISGSTGLDQLFSQNTDRLRTVAINTTYLVFKRPLSMAESRKLSEKLLKSLREHNVGEVERLIASLIEPRTSKVEVGTPPVFLVLRGGEIPLFKAFVLPSLPGIFNHEVYLYFTNKLIRPPDKLAKELASEINCHNKTSYNYTYNGLVLTVECGGEKATLYLWPLDQANTRNGIVVLANSDIAGRLKDYAKLWYSNREIIEKASEEALSTIYDLIMKARALGPSKISEKIALEIYSKHLGWLKNIQHSQEITGARTITAGGKGAYRRGGISGTMVFASILAITVAILFIYSLWKRRRE